MKQAVAIFIIAIHLCNIIGCTGLFARLEFLHERNISLKLDNDQYAGSEAITLKIPMSLPYANFQYGYERAEGKITYEGEVYRFVKQRIVNDVLYVVCLKDTRGTLIDNAYQELASTFSDRPADTESASKIGGLFIKDFVSTTRVVIEKDQTIRNVSTDTEYSFSHGVSLINTLDYPPRS